MGFAGARAATTVAHRPLLIFLHGYGGDHAEAASRFGINALADAHGIYVALPDGTLDPDGRRFWNANDACCDFHARRHDHPTPHGARQFDHDRPLREGGRDLRFGPRRGTVSGPPRVVVAQLVAQQSKNPQVSPRVSSCAGSLRPISTPQGDAIPYVFLVPAPPDRRKLSATWKRKVA